MGHRAGHITGLIAIIAAVAALGGCSGQAVSGAPGGGRVASPLTSAEAVPQSRVGPARVLAQGLEVPWGIAFLPGGDALVGERISGRLLRITPRGEVHQAGRVSGVVARGEGGLLGIAVDPAFATNRQVYAYYTAGDDNRIVRFAYLGDGRLGPPRVLVAGIPAGSIHNGGRLAFGPDGMLYASTGETGRRALAQDRSSLAGKILRMTTEGRPAPGNPFGTLVWTYGHRNVEGMAWDPAGRMYASEFGQDRFDEINLIEKGHNYGWPDMEGFEGRNKPGYTAPLLTWRTDDASPSGLAYAGGSLWVGALRGARLWRVPLGRDGRVGHPQPLLDGAYGRLRTVTRAPDGTLWVTTSNRDGRGQVRPGDDKILVVPLTSA